MSIPPPLLRMIGWCMTHDTSANLAGSVLCNAEVIRRIQGEERGFCKVQRHYLVTPDVLATLTDDGAA